MTHQRQKTVETDISQNEQFQIQSDEGELHLTKLLKNEPRQTHKKSLQLLTD